MLNTSSGFIQNLFSLPVLSRFKGALNKRSFNETSVPIHSTGIGTEIRRNIRRKFSKAADETFDFSAELKHDEYVASKLSEAVVLIGYEKSCLLSFLKNRSLGGKNILDLAGVYYTKLISLRNKYDIYRNTLPPQDLFERICKRKQEEIDIADHIIVLSSMVRDELMKTGVPSSKISVVQLGYEPSVFRPKEEYNNTGDLKFIFVGGISYRKGIAQIIEVAERSLGKAVQFILIGPVSDAGELLQHLPSNIKHIPYLNHHDLAREYRNADVFLFPSYLDSYGMVVIEAMACGLPVIVSENTGAKDIIRDAGIIIPVHDAEALMKAVDHFLENRTAVAGMGKLAAQYATQYSWDHYYNQVKTILTSFNQER